MKVTLNRKEKLYVLDHGHGYTCLGFDVLVQRLNRLQQWLNRYENIGAPSVATYKQYERTLKEAQARCIANHERCDVELTPQLNGLEGKRVEVVDAYGETRRFYVGKSTGWLPIHLEIARINSSGGMAAMGPYKSVTVVPGKTR